MFQTIEWAPAGTVRLLDQRRLLVDLIISWGVVRLPYDTTQTALVEAP